MKKQVVVFLLLAFSISWGLNAFMIAGKISQQWSILLAMWGPGLAAIITSIVFTKSLKPLGLAFKNKQYLVAGYLLPLLYAVPVYVLIWLFGFAPFNRGFDCSYFMFFTLGQVQHIFAASGEEIGWRGFLYPQLKQTNSPFMAALFTGCIWAIWHFPLIINGYAGGPPLWYLLACFSIMIVSMSFIMCWLRDKSQSVWPAILLHASHNFYIQVFLNNLTNPSPYRAYLYGEGGIGLAISTFLVASMLWLKHNKTKQVKQTILSA
jgi:membrane protease YdiL (CAAX protease family)